MACFGRDGWSKAQTLNVLLKDSKTRLFRENMISLSEQRSLLKGICTYVTSCVILEKRYK